MSGVENQDAGTRPDKSLPAHSRHKSLAKILANESEPMHLQNSGFHTRPLILQRRDAG